MVAKSNYLYKRKEKEKEREKKKKEKENRQNYLGLGKMIPVVPLSNNSFIEGKHSWVELKECDKML